MDIAEAWADPRVLYIVQMKWDSLPPIDSKKGGKGGKQKKAGGGGKAKRRASAPGEKEDTAHVSCFLFFVFFFFFVVFLIHMSIIWFYVTSCVRLASRPVGCLA